MSIATLRKRLDDIEFVIAGWDDPDNSRLFNVFVGRDWKTGELFELYADIDPDPRCRWVTYWTHEAGDLDDLMVEGFVPVLVFDPDACSYDKFREATNYYTTQEGSPERARQEEEYARAFPELKEENLYWWSEVRPGQFVEIVKEKQGATTTRKDIGEFK